MVGTAWGCGRGEGAGEKGVVGGGGKSSGGRGGLWEGCGRGEGTGRWGRGVVAGGVRVVGVGGLWERCGRGEGTGRWGRGVVAGGVRVVGVGGVMGGRVGEVRAQERGGGEGWSGVLVVVVGWPHHSGGPE